MLYAQHDRCIAVLATLALLIVYTVFCYFNYDKQVTKNTQDIKTLDANQQEIIKNFKYTSIE